MDREKRLQEPSAIYAALPALDLGRVTIIRQTTGFYRKSIGLS
jgi:hypothetical protein